MAFPSHQNASVVFAYLTLYAIKLMGFAMFTLFTDLSFDFESNQKEMKMKSAEDLCKNEWL